MSTHNVKCLLKGFISFAAHLSISTNRLATLSASVGAELVEAAHAHRLLVLLDVLLALQVVSAVEAVETLSHGGAQIAAGGCRHKTKTKHRND